MHSTLLLLFAFIALVSVVQAKGTKPPDNFGCNSFNKGQRIDVIIETGSVTFAGTDDKIRLLLRDSHGIMCMALDLDNSGDDHERNSIDYYAICCPQKFASNNDSLSLFLLGHLPGNRGAVNSWYIENAEVRKKDRVLFKYHFHRWTAPKDSLMFGASRVASSRSNEKTSSYSFIHL